MSRTIAEIYDSLIAEKEAQGALDGLLPAPETFTNLLDAVTSNSKVGIWRMWAALVSVGHWTHEQLFDIFKTEANAIAAAAPAGTSLWYQEQFLAFQFGDALEYINSKYQYAVIDPTKRIVKRCAIEERSDGVVVAKVAKEGVTGSPEPLDGTELAAVQSYGAKKKFAGTKLAVLSLNADVLDVMFEVFYDPIIPLVTVQAGVQAAIDAYIQNLPFNAKFSVTKFTDAIQGVIGVKDLQFGTASATPAGGSATGFTLTYISASGYFEYADTAANMFTWTAQP